MAQAAQRFSYASYEQALPKERTTHKPAELELVRGRRAQARQTKGGIQMNLIAIAALVFVLVLGICALRVTLSALTVNTMIQNTKIQNEINSTRSQTDDLQVQQAVFSSPDRIENIAKDGLGMIPAKQVSELALN